MIPYNFCQIKNHLEVKGVFSTIKAMFGFTGSNIEHHSSTQHINSGNKEQVKNMENLQYRTYNIHNKGLT